MQTYLAVAQHAEVAVELVGLVGEHGVLEKWACVRECKSFGLHSRVCVHVSARAYLCV